MLNRKSLQEVKTTETNLTISVVPQNIDSHSLDLLLHVNPTCIALTKYFLPLLNFLENRVYIWNYHVAATPQCAGRANWAKAL